ncbi:hypothetical protein D1872_283660 [compost metagenome]
MLRFILVNEQPQYGGSGHAQSTRTVDSPAPRTGLPVTIIPAELARRFPGDHGSGKSLKRGAAFPARPVDLFQPRQNRVDQTKGRGHFREIFQLGGNLPQQRKILRTFSAALQMFKQN